MSKSGELKYVRIANILREEILSSKYKTGEIIPSQQDFAKAFKVNRATIKLAEDILEQEGLIQCIPSVGAVIKDVPKSKTLIGYLVSSLQDPFHIELIRELDKQLSAYNAAIIVSEGKSAARLIDMGATKIIKGGQLWNTSKEDKVKTVYIGYSNPAQNCVSINNQKGMKLLYYYLKDLGHERIAYLSASIESIDEYDYRHKTLLEIYPPKLSGWIKANSFFVESYAEKELTKVLKEIRKRKPLITVLICASDWLAVEIMQCAAQIGLKIPDELSIAGFDNIFLSDRINVPLTTVGFPMEKAAEAIIEILFTVNNLKPVQRVLEPELILRKSVQKFVRKTASKKE